MDRVVAAPRKALLRFLALSLLSACSTGRTAPPSPAPAEPVGGTATRMRAMTVPVFEGFELAVSKGTRSRTGAPGPKYWQQWSEYKLEAELNPLSKRLTGHGTIKYHNRSPDTLGTVYLHLLHNIFAPGARHNTYIPWAVEGVDLAKVAAQGTTLAAAEGDAPGYDVNGTVMRMRLPKPIPPGGSADLEFNWRLRVPPDGAPRGGQDGEVYFLSYWYPQMAVYDDINGWQIDQYLGNAEFYMGYGDYDVSLTVPAGWLVTGTGSLENPADVLSAQTRARLDSASSAASVVHVVRESDREAGRSTAAGKDGKLVWRFTARNVRDFAWGTSSRYLWDATSAAVGDTDRDGHPDTSAVYSFYRPEQRISHWDEVARYGRHAIEFFSRYLWPYPWPHMSMVDGPGSCGGMEYPMMTCIGLGADTLDMYETVGHEIGHMWFPMMVGSDEKRFAWMDEGFTQFDQSQGMADFFKGFDDEARNRKEYLGMAEEGGEVELLRHGDRYPNYYAYGVATYYKPAASLVALRGVLGQETFHKAFTEYGRRWLYKHPSPWDFFATMEDVSGQDLSWFWRTWFFETWKLDQAIDTVTTVGDSVEVSISNRGKAPMPAIVVATREGGAADTVTVPVEVWLGGARRATVRVAREPAIKAIEVDPGNDFPDIDRGNQKWPR